MSSAFETLQLESGTGGWLGSKPQSGSPDASIQRKVDKLTKLVYALAFLSFVLLGVSIAAIAIAETNNNDSTSVSSSSDGPSSIPLFETQGYWTAAPPLPVPALTDHAVLVDYKGNNTSAWIIGGAIPSENGTQTVTDAVYEFDSLTALFKQKKSMPTPRYRFASALLDGKIYITGGLNAPDDNNNVVFIVPGTLIYDIASDTWTDIPTANPGNPRTDSCMTPAEGKLILAGGYSQNYTETLSSAEQFDPSTNTWTPLPSTMPSPRGDLACSSLSVAPDAQKVGNLTDNVGNDVAVFIGGYYDRTNTFTPGLFVQTVEQYNPATEKWTTLAPVLHARGDKAVCRVPNNRLLLLGGETTADGRNEVASNLGALYLPDPVDTWVSVTPMPFGRFRFGCAYLPGGNGVYIFGGATTSVCAQNATSGEQGCVKRGGSETVFKWITDEEKPDVFVYTSD